MITAEAIMGMIDKKPVTVPDSMKIIDVVRIIVESKSGAVCVEKNGQIKGLWSERDLMRNILDGGFDINTARVGDYMMDEIHVISHTARLEEIEDKFVGLYVRHLFVAKEGKIIGVITARDAMAADLNIKSDEVRNLKTYVSLEYYENWRWKKNE
jgi:CBS domain-containing protein